ncbi:MAG: cytochrome c oxidase subunit II [Acidimicrobiales bacterium]
MSKQARTILVFWVITTVVGVVLVVNIHRLLPGLLPPEASSLVHSQDFTLGFFTALAVPIAMLVWVIAAYTIVTGHTREMPSEDGPALHGNPLVQYLWLGGSATLCIGLVVYGLALLPALYTPVPGRQLVVDVTGQQWQWTFTYPGYHDVTSTSLVLPVGQPVTFKVTSVDVTHSFWVPAFGVKVDANNGEITTAYVKPNVKGNYTVRCAELCGLYHAYMQAPARVVSKAAFQSWVHQPRPTAPWPPRIPA